jgi:hypothetical protein
VSVHLAGRGFPLMPGTYYISSSDWDEALEIELKDRAVFDLYHADMELIYWREMVF